MDKLNFYIKKLQDLEYRGEWKEHFRHSYEKVYELIDLSTFFKRGEYLKELERLRNILLDMPYIADDEDRLHFRRIQKNIIDLLYKVMEENKRIFLVQGADSALTHKVSTFLGRLKLDFELLEKENDEIPDIRGFLQIAKNRDYAIVLLSADQMIYPEHQQGRWRVSQNVLLEFGYFLSSIGKKNILILYTADREIELPYHFEDIPSYAFHPESEWKQFIIGQLQNSGIYLDPQILTRITDGGAV